MTTQPLQTDEEPKEDALTATTPEDDVQMTIWEHLGELRKRLTRAAIALVAGAIVTWNFKEELLEWIADPARKEWAIRFPNKPFELQTLAPMDAFVNFMQLSLTGGVVLAAPVIFYQLWAFVSPGLYAREKRYIIPFVLLSTFLFCAGIVFCNQALFPSFYAYQFSLTGKIGKFIELTHRPTMELLLDFATRMLLACGFAFEMPLFIAALALAGIVTPKQLVKFSRWAIIGSFVLGAFITPGPEISSQLIVSAALVVLYFISVGLAFLVARKPKPTTE